MKERNQEKQLQNKKMNNWQHISIADPLSDSKLCVVCKPDRIRLPE